MEQSALTLDPEQVTAARAFDDEPLGGAREEVRDHGVDRDPPPRDHDPRLARRDEDRADPAPRRLTVELDRHRLLADRAVGPDRKDDARLMRQVLTGRDAQVVRRPPDVAKLDALTSGELGELRIIREELMHARLDVQACLDRRPNDL